MRLFWGIISAFILSFSVLAETVIRNATAITLNRDQVIENAVVVIKGDRITYVGTRIPRGISIDLEIDGTGKYLIPGLTEMHGHLPSASATSEEAEQTLFLFLAGGVTTVRGMLGHPSQFEMRELIAGHELAGPTLYLAAPSLNGRTVSSVDEGIAKVKKYHADGWDLLKIHPGLTSEEYLAIAKTAHQLKMPFGGHVPADVGIETALAANQTSIDHIDGFLEYIDGYTHEITDVEIRKITALYKRNRPSWLVPTQALFGVLVSGGDPEKLAARTENAYMPASTRRSWANRLKTSNNNANEHGHPNRQRILKALSDSGARIVMGSDAPQLYSVPGFSIWREIETLKEAGLSAADILTISTKNAGLYFADKDSFGQINEGMRADLLLLEADPRIDASNLTKQSGVMAAGRWYSRATIDAKLAEIAKKNR